MSSDRRLALPAVVEGSRSQLIGGPQLEVLGDLVDFDFGLDTDFAPQTDDHLNDLVILGLEPACRLDLERDRIVGPETGSGQKLLAFSGS